MLPLRIAESHVNKIKAQADKFRAEAEKLVVERSPPESTVALVVQREPGLTLRTIPD